jgi:hypothetical protein
MKTAARFLVVALTMTAATLGSFGCANAYQNKPAPAMASTTERWVDLADSYSYMRNINQRGFIDDFNRSIYIDNPTRLSPWPIVDMSGNPR